MFIRKYFYKAADLKLDNNSMIISDTKDRRNEYMNEVFYDLYKDEISKFKTTGKTALLYIGGAGEHHSCSRDYQKTQKGIMPVKSQLGYIASKTAKRIGNISYLSINSNACASSMHALYEAEQLLENGFDDVIIYGEEWVEDVELMLFKQHNIDVVCSDGFFILQLGKNGKYGGIFNPTFIWNDDRSPFEVSKDGYIKAMKPFEKNVIHSIKVHGSGTAQNNKVENEAIEELFGRVICNIKTIEYKSQIGHSQGCSTGIELCMLIDDFYHKENKSHKTFLVNASGLGNFYGSCLVVI